MTIADLLTSLGPSFQLAADLNRHLAQTRASAQQFERESAVTRDILGSLGTRETLLQDVLGVHAVQPPALSFDRLECTPAVDAGLFDALFAPISDTAAQLQRELEQREEIASSAWARVREAKALEALGLASTPLTGPLEQLAREHRRLDHELAGVTAEARRVAVQFEDVATTLSLGPPQVASLMASITATNDVVAAARLVTPPDDWRPVLAEWQAELRHGIAITPTLPELADYRWLWRDLGPWAEATTRAAAVDALSGAITAVWGAEASPLAARGAAHAVELAIATVADLTPAEAAGVARDERLLFGLMAALGRVLSEVMPGLSDVARVMVVATVLAAIKKLLIVLPYLAPDLYSVVKGWQDGREEDARHTEVMHELSTTRRHIESLADGLAAQAGSPTASRPRYRVHTPLNFREEPTSRGRRLATLAPGQEFVVHDRMGRWLAVELDPPLEGVARTGWVYQHCIELVVLEAPRREDDSPDQRTRDGHAAAVVPPSCAREGADREDPGTRTSRATH